MRVSVWVSGAPWAALALAFAGCGSCTRYNEEFCCLSLENCAEFDVDEIRACDPAFACVENVCVSRDGAVDVDGGGDNQCALAGGIIAFQTDRDGDTEIARMYADGSGFQPLTANAWPDEAPKVSPDGTKIAWLTSPAGVRELYVMNVDGSGAHAVSNGPVSASLGPLPQWFRWAPDSTRLLFSTTRDGATEIYVVQATAAMLANLTNNAAVDAQGDWSPDGSRIVFYSQRDASGLFGDYYLMNADGSDPTALTGDPRLVTAPRWSPGGTRIAGTITDVSTPNELWLFASGNGGGTNLGVLDVREYEWSPDGSRITYTTSPDVFAIGMDGSGLTNLTNGVGFNDWPMWSPDGSQIVFASDRDGNSEIYSIEATGGTATNLTNDPSSDLRASPGPCAAE